MTTFVLASAALFWIAVIVRHVWSYFFVFDDFAFLSMARSTSFPSIASQPVLGFYRPLGHMLFKLIFLASGNTPLVYAGVAAAVHAINAALVFVLGRRLHLPARAAGCASVLFLLSAPAAETYFWSSAAFDRLAGMGMLLALLGGLTVRDSTPGQTPWRAWGYGLAGACLSLFAKEAGVLVAPLFVVTALVPGTPSRLRPAAAYALCLVLAAGTYLAIRSALLPGLGGAYGDFGTLFQKAAVGSNIIGYLRNTVIVPLPAPENVARFGTIIALAPGVLAACWILVFTRRLADTPRRAGLFALAWGIALVPVLWISTVPGSSAAGRFLYVPGIWGCLLLGSASSDDASGRFPRALSPRIVGASLLLILLFQAVSVAYQQNVWLQAFRLSRIAIDQLRPFADRSDRIFIANLPYWYAEGPYILQPYAFAGYYGQEFKPVVRGRTMGVSFRRGENWFAGWVPVGPETADSGETTISLELPIRFPTPRPAAQIVFPSSGVMVRQPFRIEGWAIDEASPDGCGVGVVHVYAASVATGAQTFIGPATLGERSEETAGRYGRRFRRCGWWVRADGLRPGRYRLLAYPHDTLTAAFTEPAFAIITVR